ncbi:alanyl-tRNA synthetase [Lacrimispora xylanisolvens]|uniref:Alanine--tRNA ligase n=1 Tax=Lacrimispora xylanisolvens TaxID=384636 RepID=A0A2S6HQC7_9FIRM|nr:alanine--tRNA ligase [Hungatella xylanolytica]PPK79648.1 alanyl-tRNA synthetase [Hungatella xylanolytica]
MTASELRKMFVDFFKEKGHKVIASASLMPENDPTVLFTTAGMHPLVPYLLGESHPQGRRLTSIQKCLRTGDIDEVGDDTHLTFFEMMGNWSLGDYFKEEVISMSFDFLTNVLNIPIERIAVTVFEGDLTVPKDTETEAIWKNKGLKQTQIYAYGREENWWGPPGQTGPCGPDTEIFYDMGKAKCSDHCGPACKCGKYVEIWNLVFMKFKREADGSFTEFKQKNVDTGMGLERVLTIFNGKTNVYDTELFIPVMTHLNNIIGELDAIMSIRDKRIICEHIRAVCFILGDTQKICPSNTEQGYILRRLIRRMIRLFKKAGINQNYLCDLAEVIIRQYQDAYPELAENQTFIKEQLQNEIDLFLKTLDMGLKKADQYLEKTDINTALSGELAFKLYDTYGFPIEFTCELARERGRSVDMESFREKFTAHQNKSREGAAEKFKGGLADHSMETARLHTATHLLNAALRKVLGDEVSQRGSNITPERLRFDFSFHRKVTPEELREVEKIVNEAIDKQIEITMKEMKLNEAYALNAVGVFTNKYEDTVKVYSIPGYSVEICGGPHAGNTGELGSFKIVKEEASSAGVRRIKAVLKEGKHEQ